MNNNFEFSYFVPTPDTTANCALSRWNDGLMNLSDFIKSYMGTRQSLEFGFSRNLNIKELLNLGLTEVLDKDNKKDYVINYKKYGDIKAYVCGFEVNIVDELKPFMDHDLFYGKTYSDNTYYTLFWFDNTISHVFNYKNNYSEEERFNLTIQSFNEIRHDVNEIMSIDEIKTYFGENNKQTVLTKIDNTLTYLNSIDSNAKHFIFGYDDIYDIKEIADVSQLRPYLDLNPNNYNENLYKDLLCFCKYRPTYSYNNNFRLPLSLYPTSRWFYKEIILKYFNKRGLDVSLSNKWIDNCYKFEQNKHVIVRFLFSLKEEPSVTPYLSHDGTSVPLSLQKIMIDGSYQEQDDIRYGGSTFLVKKSWDTDLECPLYYDADGVAHPMTLENNVDGMGGKDYTFWSSPVQKTEDGYLFECCMPLAFYNEETQSYGNEYYATKQHDGIEIGQVMYRVPVVKRMRQNIEEAIVNTHLAKCVQDLIPADNSNAQSDNTLIFGGVVVDDFTAGLYPVAETQSIASETEYGEVKIIKTKTDGQDNGVLDLMYHYSETGELTYNDKTMPENGRAIDMITLFDTLNSLSTSENHFSDSNKIVDENDFNILKNRVVTTHAADSETQGDNQTIYGDKYFVNKIFINEEHNNSVVCGSIIGDDLNGNPIFGFDSYYHNVQIFLMDDNDENKSLILNCYNGTIGFETKDNGKIVFSTNVINHNFSDFREIIYSNINTYTNILNLSINQNITTNPEVDWRNVVFKSEWNVPNTNLNYGFGFHGDNIIADDENNNKTNMCNFVFYASSRYNSGNFAMITLTAFEDTSIELSADKIQTKGDFLPETSVRDDIGSSTNKYKDAYFSGTVNANSFSGTLTGDVTGNVTGNLSGLIPYSTSSSVPVGSILLVIIVRATTLSSDDTISCGETVSGSLSGGDYNIYAAAMSITTGNAVQAIVGGNLFLGTFVLMSEVTFRAQGDRCPALVIKIDSE